MSRLRLLYFALRQRNAHASTLTLARAHPTSFRHRTPKPRYFTQRPCLALISRAASRPQLPFLNTSLSRISNPSLATRHISDDRKARLKALIRWNIRLQVYVWSAFFLGLVAYNGLEQIRFERKYPTPQEWGFWSRWYLRNAKIKEYEDKAKVNRVATDWQKVGVSYSDLVKNLENEKKDGSNIVRRQWNGADGINGGGDMLVDGLSAVGFDVTAKTEEWRRGYCQGLMGAGRAAEHLDGMAKPKNVDLIKSYIIPWNSVLGPNNPRPKKLPWDRKGIYEKVHKEEDMENAYESPQYYYMRILTTIGFTTRQRLDAALAYADWLDYKKMFNQAESMYDWALDIAAGGLPDDAGHVVDIKTGIINKGNEKFITSNLLSATTAMGVHYAKRGEVQQALPIFLSVLRARRGLPPAPVELPKTEPVPQEEDTGIMSYLTALKDLVIDKPYPKPPPNGNEVPHHSMQGACEEVGLMTYIGEILFATSEKEREKGLSWTRDSVGAAEAVLWFMDEKNDEDEQARDKCRECLETGLNNWRLMARQMVLAAKRKENDVEKGNGWLGLGLGKDTALENAKKDTARWQEEEIQIGLMKEKTASLLSAEAQAKRSAVSV